MNLPSLCVLFLKDRIVCKRFFVFLYKRMKKMFKRLRRGFEIGKTILKNTASGNARKDGNRKCEAASILVTLKNPSILLYHRKLIAKNAAETAQSRSSSRFFLFSACI